MKKLKSFSGKIWDCCCEGFAGILSAVFILSLILFFSNNLLVYEPLYNLLLLIGLLLAMVLYMLSKFFGSKKWKRNWLMLMAALNFLMIIWVFMNLLGLAA